MNPDTQQAVASRLNEETGSLADVPRTRFSALNHLGKANCTRFLLASFSGTKGAIPRVVKEVTGCSADQAYEAAFAIWALLAEEAKTILDLPAATSHEELGVLPDPEAPDGLLPTLFAQYEMDPRALERWLDRVTESSLGPGERPPG